MDIRILEGDFTAFFEAPFACYGRDAYIASPPRHELRAMLDPMRNPLLRTGRASLTWFTAHHQGRVVGRITAHIHHASNQLHGLSQGFFGMFDCIDDEAVARALLDAAAQWTHERGCTEFIGAFNLVATGMVGVLTDGFAHRPCTYQDWSPPHVARLLEALGFERHSPMRTFEVGVGDVAPGSLIGPAQQALLADPEWRFERMSKRRMDVALRESCALLNDGFAANPMFVPMSEEEFAFSSEGLSMVMDETLSCIARHRGRPVGVMLCIPDLNPLLHDMRYRLGWSTPWSFLRHRLGRRKRAALLFCSVRRDYQAQGVSGVLLQRLLQALHDGGYASMGISWVSDANTASLRQVAKAGGRPLHRLHLFRKALP